MAFTDVQKDQIRTYMGMPRLFAQSNAVLENAMSAIENLSTLDGGATETAVKTALTNIASIEAQILANSTLMLATEVMDEVKFDAIRNDAGLRKVGRSYIHQLSIRLSMMPQEDYFAAAPVSNYPGIRMHDV